MNKIKCFRLRVKSFLCLIIHQIQLTTFKHNGFVIRNRQFLSLQKTEFGIPVLDSRMVWRGYNLLR